MVEQQTQKLLEARFWTCQETAQYLGVSIHTLYKKMSLGICPISIKRPMGSRPKFDRKDVIGYADSL